MCYETAVVSQFKNISLRLTKGNYQLLLDAMKPIRISDSGRTATPGVSKQTLTVPDKHGFDLRWDDHSLASV